MRPWARPFQRLLTGLRPASPSRGISRLQSQPTFLQPSPFLRYPLRPYTHTHLLNLEPQRNPGRDLSAPTPENPNSRPTPGVRAGEPTYYLSFTCKPCRHRSAHKVSKQGYHHGTVLIQCPSCRDRHVISDHLKIFMDQASTLEDILSRQGELIKKGKLGIRQGSVVGNEGEENIEFWDDGTESQHKGAQEESATRDNSQ